MSVMIDAGYFAKRVAKKPDWLPTPQVLEICSVSNCFSKPPDQWIEHWLHNSLGWFNRSSDAMSVVPASERDAYRLFAYRLYPEIFREGTRVPFALPPEVRIEQIPDAFQTLGFDSVNNPTEPTVSFECSPLSCNAMAAEYEVNRYCLFPSLEAAIAGATRFSIEEPEPGDYFVVEVLEHRTVR
jgi:hypothetical protein